MANASANTSAQTFESRDQYASKVCVRTILFNACSFKCGRMILLGDLDYHVKICVIKKYVCLHVVLK